MEIYLLEVHPHSRFGRHRKYSQFPFFSCQTWTSDWRMGLTDHELNMRKKAPRT